MNDNKLIAEFMEWDIKSPTSMPRNLHLSNLELDNGEVWAYKFHTSWDWLMPVLDKIKEIRCLPDDHDESFSWVCKSSDIEAEYNAVVEFIKEYNDGCHQTYNDERQ